jgi:hypothetical protein
MPLSEEVTSKTEETSGVVVPIPTWAFTEKFIIIIVNKPKSSFLEFIIKCFESYHLLNHYN